MLALSFALDSFARKCHSLTTIFASAILRRVSITRRRTPSATSPMAVNAGYGWEQLAPCMGFLHYKDIPPRAVTCDAPIAQTGGQDRPIVVDQGTGRRSDNRDQSPTQAPAPAVEGPIAVGLETPPPALKERRSVLGNKS